ncbi:MAG: lytic transglycosylase domain-containing protein [Alphaproteobacteria bacterium]|nr:lytic transglycosylase domain-containing protein [Alphaproteobacteria bacterium]
MNRSPMTLRAAALALAGFLLATTALAAPSPAPAPSKVEVQRMVIAEAMNTRVPPALALAVARVESGFDAAAESYAGARGVMQIMPRTAADEFGVAADELWNARLNVQLGIDFLGQLYDRYGRWDLALSHYNGGSVLGEGRNARPLPATRRYVAAVLAWERHYRDQAVVWEATIAARAPAWTPARTQGPALDDGAAIAARAEVRLAQIQAAGTAEPGRVDVPPAPPAPAAAPAVAVERWRPAEPAAAEIVRVRRPLDPLSAIDARRARIRPLLDDFSPAVRWSEG